MTVTQQIVKTLYKDELGYPIELTPGQDAIFAAIYQQLSPRVHVMCHTRYGKSLTVALAVLTRASTFPEKWAIMAGTKEKAKIIMDYVIAHIFDNDYTKFRFMPDKGENLEEIRRHRNKNRLTFKVSRPGDKNPLFGDIYIGAAKDALGQGATRVIEDESALIDDNEHSLVMRMLGDKPNDNFLCKIGNPFNRNHFLNSYHDPAYKKIVVDCYRSLAENRMTQQVIDENKNYSFFKILYECRFPSQTEVDEQGWMYLVTDQDIETAQNRVNQMAGTRRLGVDVARSGRNYNAWVLRCDNYARVLKKDLDPNLTSTGDTTINLMAEHGIAPKDVYVDDSGVGGGVTDYLKSRQVNINPVNFGSSASDPEMSNNRAEMYAGKQGLQAWLKQVGQLEKHKDWIELTRIRYKKDFSGKVKIEPKEEMRKRGIESPDIADALALTFAISTNSVYSGIDPQFILQGGVKPYFT